METGWVDRLWTAIKEDGRSERAISLEAGLGVNYLGQTRGRGSSPVSEKLNSVLDVLGKEAALYVMTGVRINSAGIDALNALIGVPEHLRNNAIGLLRAMAQDQTPPDHESAQSQSAGDPAAGASKAEAH
jgi:hypothetical protein